MSESEAVGWMEFEFPDAPVRVTAEFWDLGRENIVVRVTDREYGQRYRIHIVRERAAVEATVRGDNDPVWVGLLRREGEE